MPSHDCRQGNKALYVKMRVRDEPQNRARQRGNLMQSGGSRPAVFPAQSQSLFGGCPKNPVKRDDNPTVDRLLVTTGGPGGALDATVEGVSVGLFRESCAGGDALREIASECKSAPPPPLRIPRGRGRRIAKRLGAGAGAGMAAG
jgi:hypothetical protein